ncbi:hypothetical protein LTS18_009638 [Coniosporium uncinatum]|uniref:Uncharacterized protein n=1 Tax=Coniosporium uncinatum TaxID=93489 RepID=A0ACC3D0D2_9PEZI|nr:hypothetical protein LTS18_009638 [Coniosporium uncinatum]
MASAVYRRPPVSNGIHGETFNSVPRMRSSSSSSTSTASVQRPNASPTKTPNSRSYKSSLSSTIHPGHTEQLRSQYPSDSTENHVEYILVASFDIDRGSVMEHQYPGPISGDEHMLAELMLPDQAHMRNQDWTIFFLHKDTSAEDEAREARRERRKRKRRKERGMEELDEGDGGTSAEEDADEEVDDEDYSDEENDNDEGPPLVYVLNLVNTKQDNTVKR